MRVAQVGGICPLPHPLYLRKVFERCGLGLDFCWEAGLSNRGQGCFVGGICQVTAVSLVETPDPLRWSCRGSGTRSVARQKPLVGEEVFDLLDEDVAAHV
jgi:hypothetical protein